MNHMQVVRKSVDEEAVDSGMPWRVYLVEDFAFADAADEDPQAEGDASRSLDVFVDAPPSESDAVRASQLPDVHAELADLGASVNDAGR